MADNALDLNDFIPQDIMDVAAAWSELLAYMLEHDDGRSFACDMAHDGAWRETLIAVAVAWRRWNAEPAGVADILEQLAPRYPTRPSCIAG